MACKTPNFDTLESKYSTPQGKSATESSSFAQMDSKNENIMTNREHVELVIGRIIDAKIDITSEYKDWMDCLFALATEFGEGGRDYAHQISQFYPRYNPKEVDDQYSNCLNKGRNAVRIGSLMHIAKDYGIDISLPSGYYPAEAASGSYQQDDNAKDKKKKGDRLNIIISIRNGLSAIADFRHNTVTERYELRYKKDIAAGWKEMNDTEFNTLYTSIKTIDARITKGDTQSVIESRDFHSEYNPIKEYLDSLSKWKPEEHEGEDPISDFFNVIHFDEDQKDFALKYCKRWFLNYVALMSGKIPSNELMPCFLGYMGSGKSWFCKHIVPPCLRNYFDEIRPNDKLDKDQLINMSNKILISFEEFKVNNRTSNMIKAILSIEKTNVREAYGRYAKTRKRLCSFVANGNDKIFLAEEAGDRRYISIIVKGTDHIDDNTLPYEAAYAQALYLINQPDYRSSLTQEENQEIAEHNKEFVEPDPNVELVSKYYRIPKDDEKGVKLTATDIWTQIKAHVNTNDITPAKIGQALQKMGFEYTKTGGKHKYYVLEIDINESAASSKQEGESYFFEKLAKRRAEEEAKAEAERNRQKEIEESTDIFHSAAMDELYDDREDESTTEDTI